MLKFILDTLNEHKLYGVSENIDFAKGAYRYPRSAKEVFRIGKRWLKRKR